MGMTQIFLNTDEENVDRDEGGLERIVSTQHVVQITLPTIN